MKKKIAIFKNGIGVRFFDTMKPEYVFLKENEVMIIDPDLSKVEGLSAARCKLVDNEILPRKTREDEPEQ